MLGFVRNWFSPKAAPIGIDLGTDTLRLAQCVHDGREWQLHAAACTDVPATVRMSAESLNDYLSQTIRALVAEGNFVGRDCVMSVPSASVHLQHLRLPRLDEAELKKALPWEVKDKLPIDSAHAVLRHMIAGDVQVNNEPRQEVIVMATPKSAVSQMLYVAGRARLNVMAVNVEARAIVDCFSHVYRRKADADITVAYIDLGCLATRVTIARAGRIMFARSIPIGGDTLSHAVAKSMQISFEQAKLLRIQLAAAPLQRPAPKPVEAQPTTDVDDLLSFALLGISSDRRQSVEPVNVIVPSLTPDVVEQATSVDAATAPLIQQLCEELNLCRRYHDTTFTQSRVDRLVFIGGEARQRPMCQRIAQSLGVAAQLGDPLVRMSKTTRIGPECGIDLTQPQPAWAVAIGLSMGPLADESITAKSA